LIVGVVIAIGAVWGYAVYAKQIIYCSQIIGLAISGFAFVTMLRAIFGGYLQGSISWALLASPFLCIVTVQYLSEVASNSYYAEYQQLAVENGVIRFYFEILSAEHQKWVFYQIGGLLLVFASELVYLGFLLHYFSTVNFAYGSRLTNMWRTMSYSTRYFSGWSGAILIVLAVLLSWLLLAGHIYQFFRK
jgi:hypothetical protein